MITSQIKPNKELAKQILSARLALEDVNMTSVNDNEYGIYYNRYETKLEDLGRIVLDYFDNIETEELVKIAND